MTVDGRQEHKTTGDHISLVEGKHSLEVKGDLAKKVSGALGIKVDGDIVLESSSRISLKVGSSFVVIHAGGVDITGPKINLNGGGSPGTPVSTLQPVVLEALTDEGQDENADDSGEDNGDSGEDGGNGSGGDNEPPETPPNSIYNVRYLMQFGGTPYLNTRYIARLSDGSIEEGTTDAGGYTKIFYDDNEKSVVVNLVHNISLKNDSYWGIK